MSPARLGRELALVIAAKLLLLTLLWLVCFGPASRIDAAAHVAAALFSAPALSAPALSAPALCAPALCAPALCAVAASSSH